MSMFKKGNQGATLLVALALAIIGCMGDGPTGPLASDGRSPAQSPAGPPADTIRVPADTSRGPSQLSSAFIWSPDGGIREIPAPAGFSLIAADINDSAEVTGMIVDSRGRYVESFIWSEAEGLRRLGSLSGFDGGVIVTGINSSGTVVGYQHAFTGSRIRAFVASARSGLSALSDEEMWAGGINEAGTIVGGRPAGPFLLKPDTGFESLALTVDECTVATAINDAGEALGWSGNELYGMGCVPQAWIVWRGKEAPVAIATCRSGCSIDLFAINDDGVAAGNDTDGAVRVTTRGTSSTEKLPGFGASDINDRGDVAATSRTARQPAVWTAAGEIVYIPIPRGRTAAVAKAINNRGEVVGAAW